MLSPNTGLLIWQIVVLIHLFGTIYALVNLGRQHLSFRLKSQWGLLVLVVPLGWLAYLLLKPAAGRRS